MLTRRSVYDIGVSAAIIGAAGLIYWDALQYGPGTFDPLGSGKMPRMVAVAIIVLCVVAIAQSLFTRPPAPKPAGAEAEAHFERRPWLALAIFIYAIICSILLYFRLPFGIASSLMLFASILSIKRWERSIIVPAALCSLVFGFGLTYLFGSVFGVDLP